MNCGMGKVGSIVNWDIEEHKALEMMFELSKIVYFIWLRVPNVNLVSLMAASKSINSSSFGSSLLQVLIAFVIMLMLV